MSYLELQALTRAHELFGGSGPAAGLDANTAQFLTRRIPLWHNIIMNVRRLAPRPP